MPYRIAGQRASLEFCSPWGQHLRRKLVCPLPVSTLSPPPPLVFLALLNAPAIAVSEERARKRNKNAKRWQKKLSKKEAKREIWRLYLCVTTLAYRDALCCSCRRPSNCGRRPYSAVRWLASEAAKKAKRKNKERKIAIPRTPSPLP